MMLFSFLDKHFAKRMARKGSGSSPVADAEVRPGLATPSSDTDEMTLDTHDTHDDYDAALAQKARRDGQLSRSLAQVCAAVVCGWAVGCAADLPLGWKMLALAALLAAVAGVWRASLAELLDHVVRYETLRVRRKKALQYDETAEWVNFLLNRWWIFCSPTLFTIVKERLDPLLNEVKPSIVESVELRQFTLGNQTPYLKSVKVFDVSQGRRLIQSLKSLQVPPSGLALNVHHQLALEADVSLDSDDFQMVLRTRLFGKGMGMDMDLAMEKLNISGKLYSTCTLNMEAPFPHITHLSLTFLEKPQVWFSIRILKAVQMMAVPLLKGWIHALVMDALVTSLVDPGKLDFHLTPHDRPAPAQETGDPDAQGVVTVTLAVTYSGSTSEERRWLVLTLGSQRCVSSQLTQRWQESPSFLVTSLQTENLLIKLKSKRFVSSITLTQYELQLANYNLDSSRCVETVLQRKVARSGTNNVPAISVRLEYTPLPGSPLDQPVSVQKDNSALESTISGVMFVYIHGAVGLASSDKNDCNPYCMVFNSRKKVKTTHYLKGTSNPQWESRTQFLVSDCTQVSLSFVVGSWSPNKMVETDLLGLAILNYIRDERHIFLALNGNTGSAGISVSVIFQPVASVARSDGVHGNEPIVEDEAIPFNRAKRNSNTWMQQAKMLLTRDQDTNASDISNLLSSGLGLMEVTLIRARDLVSRDLNGFSDPYCELKINGECKYKSSVKKKTLNPTWEESAIMGLPRPGEVLDVVLWDHDTFGMKDFLGNVTFGLDDIRHYSNMDGSHSCQLQGVKSGVVDLKIKVISEDTESLSYQGSANSSTSSPRLPIRNELIDSYQRRLSVDRTRPPPPTPPRTVTLGYKLPATQPAPVTDDLSISSKSSSPLSVPTVTVTDLQPEHAMNNIRHTPNSLSPTYDGGIKKTPEYSSFRNMKQKVRNGLKLRRFKSEVCVKAVNGGGVRYTMEPSGGGESDATELLQMDGLSHAVSQPNILQPHVRNKRPMNLNVTSSTQPNGYIGIQGTVLQAQGLNVARVAQLYCRIRLHSTAGSGSGKTIAKSRLLPALANVRLDLEFQLDRSGNFPPTTALVFEVRSTGKELVATCTATLYELLHEASQETNEAHTWLSLSNGASLEVKIAHNRDLKKPARNIFRSWSVHRMGKI